MIIIGTIIGGIAGYS